MSKVIPFEEKYKPPTPEQLAEKQRKAEELKQKRREILAKAREKAFQTYKERKEKKEMLIRSSAISLTKNVEEIVDNYLLKHSAQAIKASFFQAFELSGGKKALVNWVKESPKNRLEFYKMLTALVRQSDEEEKGASGTKIVVNIVGPDNNKQELRITDQTLQFSSTPNQLEPAYVEL